MNDFTIRYKTLNLPFMHGTTAHKIEIYSPIGPFARQTDHYLALRSKEGWLESVDAIRQWPHVPSNHPHARLWAWRRRSLARLMQHLQRELPPTANILDLGCGNGWMSNRLAALPGTTIWACDVNIPELELGAAVFPLPNIKWVYADVFNSQLPKSHFDAIILAGSAQYFPDIRLLLDQLRQHLAPVGCIHIIDTNFYNSNADLQSAKDASRRYFEGQNAADMAPYYHHHLAASAKQAGTRDLNDTFHGRWMQRLGFWSPFPWLAAARRL